MERAGTGRRLRGTGARVVRAHGGPGQPGCDDGTAQNWMLHPALCGVSRLRIVSWLCANGPAKSLDIVKALRVPYISAMDMLNGMRSYWLVEATPIQGEKPRAWEWQGGAWGVRWSVSDGGRRWLWRFGWVTNRLVPRWWDGVHWTEEDMAEPWQVLREDAEPSLMRPSWLALAKLMQGFGPLNRLEYAKALGMPSSAVAPSLRKWQQAGWLKLDWKPTRLEEIQPPHGPRAPRYLWNRAGIDVLGRHARALRWAAQHSGYAVPDDDFYLLDQDIDEELNPPYVVD